jgi:hypothetical protein
LKENGEKERRILAILNSSLIPIFVELSGRVNLGQGALDVKVYEYGRVPIVNPVTIKEEHLAKISSVLDSFLKREIASVFDEVGANSPKEVSLDKVKPDRRELDKIVLGEILGLTEEEQLEVYRAIIDLVNSRFERAKSVQKRKKVGELDVDELVNSVLRDVERLHGVEAKRFPEDYIGECPHKVVEVPKGSKVEAGLDIEGPYVQIDKEKIRCASIYEAKYIEYAILAGKTSIPIPEDENILKQAVEERGRLLEHARRSVEGFLNEAIADKKLREKVRFEVFRRLGI